MEMACVSVRRNGDRWSVTRKGLDWFLADFVQWQDALDYARGIAVTICGNVIVEGEDLQGRISLRQIFSTDPSGIVHVQSVSC